MRRIFIYGIFVLIVIHFITCNQKSPTSPNIGKIVLNVEFEPDPADSMQKAASVVFDSIHVFIIDSNEDTVVNQSLAKTGNVFKGSFEVDADETYRIEVACYQDSYLVYSGETENVTANSNKPVEVTVTIAPAGKYIVLTPVTFQISPGNTQQLKVVSVNKNDVSKDVTDKADYSVSPAEMGTVNSTGLFTVSSTWSGVGQIMAAYADMTDSSQVAISEFAYDTVAAPVFDPKPDTYHETQYVTITCATDGAEIRYTTDGIDPDDASSIYSSSVEIPENTVTTLKAKAYKIGYVPSDITTGEYRVVLSGSDDPCEPNDTMEQAYPLSFDCQEISDGDTTCQWSMETGLEINPTSDQDWFSFYAAGGDTLHIICKNTSQLNSQIVLYYDQNLVAAENMNLLDDEWLVYVVPQGESGQYYAGIGNGFSTMKSLAQTDSTGSYGLSFQRIHHGIPMEQVATPEFDPEPGTSDTTVSVTITCATSGATIYYTTNSADPTSSDSVYSESITISSTTTLRAMAVKTGWIDSEIAGGTYTISNSVASPSFDPLPGTYDSARNVAITTDPSDASIYYTTDGSEPAESAMLYSVPVSIDTTTTLKARAYKTGYTPSGVTSGTYTIQVNTSPTASFTVDHRSADMETTFTFDASGCSDDQDDTAALQVRWDWENDGSFDTNYSTTKSATHQFSSEDNYTVLLEVMDSGGLTDTTSKQVTVSASMDTSTVIDIEGNVYKTVKIGDQWWMAENLKVTHYQNGDEIPNLTEDTDWANDSTGGYCAYENNETLVGDYGYLYNYRIIDDVRGIAPEGWRIPTDEDWKELEQTLGMSQEEADASGKRGTDEGGRLKDSGLQHWTYPNTGATNSSGFTALPGSYRFINGIFFTLGEEGYFWTSTDATSESAYYRRLHHDDSEIYRLHISNKSGLSIRCILGEETLPSLLNIGVSPSSVTLENDSTQQFTCIATYSDYSTLDVTAWTEWSVDPGTAGSIDSDGLFTAHSSSTGLESVTASYQGKTGEAAVSVSTAGTVSTPAFIPPAGTYTTAQDVTISCATSGATIYYTTNGSTPDNTKTEYTGAINVPLNTTITIKAIAYKEGWTESDIASATYKVTGTVEDPTFDPSAGTYSSAQDVTISCSTSGAMIYYTTDGSTPDQSDNQYTSAVSISTTTTLKARAYKTDWENSDVVSGTYTIQINTEPTASFTIDPASGTTETSFSFDASGCSDTEDEASVLQVRWDWDNNGTYDTGYTTTKTASHQYASTGTKTIKLQVRDSGGLTHTTTHSVTVNALSLTITSPNGGERWDLDTQQTISWTDNLSGNVKIELLRGSIETLEETIASSTPSDGSQSWTVSGDLPYDENYKIQITSIDHPSVTDKSNSGFTIGNASPTASFTVDPTSGTISTNFSVDASGCSDTEDETSALQVRWDWENDGTYDTSFSTTKITSHTYSSTGTKTIKLMVRDTGGLTNATTVSVDVTAINSAPTTYIQSIVPNPAPYDSNVRVYAYAIDPDGDQVEFKINWGDRFGTESDWEQLSNSGSQVYFEWYYDVLGDHDIRVKARDQLGNEGTWSDPATVTIYGLVTSPTFSPDGGTYSSAQTVFINCGTPGATIYYSLDGSDPTESSTQYVAPISIESTTTVKARAYKTDWTESDISTGVFIIE